MKKLFVLCSVLVGMCVALGPAFAAGPALKVVDFPTEKLMVVYADRDSVPGYTGVVDVREVGKFTLLKLVDYSEGSEQAASLPWGHKMATKADWKKLESMFKDAMAAKDAAPGLLSSDKSGAVFYEVKPDAAEAVSQAGSSKEVKEILDSSATPAISQYILDKGSVSWWPPQVPEEVPTL